MKITMSQMYELSLPGCPLYLGTPLKVSTAAWGKWGIRWDREQGFSDLVKESEQAYDNEWSCTNSEGLKDIARAAELSGLGDANQRLNEAVAQEIKQLLDHSKEQLYILDLGAGSGETAAAVIRAAPSLVEQAKFHLVDPAKESLEEACTKLAEAGLVIGKTLHTDNAKDIEVLRQLDPETVDIITANASVHHHAFLAPVFEGISKALRPGGWIVIGDWFNSMWTSPTRVYELLNELQWQGKEQQLIDFRRNFGYDECEIKEAVPELEAANRQICDFWINYAKTKDPSTPPFFLLEGHRPTNDYICGLAEYGVHIQRGPVKLLTGSSLLSVLVAQKEK